MAKIELENIGLSVSKMLGVFVKKLTADGKYSFPNREELLQPVQLQLSTKRFSEFFVAYLKSKSNVEHVEKKMSLIGYVFSKLETAKDVVS